MMGLAEIAGSWASLPQISSVHLSQDGRWIWFCMDGLHETTEVYVLDLSGGEPRRLTFGTDHFSIREVRADGSQAIVAQSENSDEHDQLFLLHRDGSLKQLTPKQHSHYVYGGSFQPGSDSITFIANMDYDTGKVTEGGWLWTQSLTTGERTCLIQTDSVFESGVEFSPSGKHLLWHRHDKQPGGAQIWVMDADGSNPHEVVAFGDKSPLLGHWLDDERIAFVTDGPVNDRVGVLSLTDGRVDWLADDANFNPQDLIIGKGDIACVAYRNSSIEPVLLPSGKPIPNATGRRSILPTAAFPNGDWLVEAYDADAPHALFRLAKDGSARLLFQPPAPKGCTFVRPRDWRWAAADGTRCQGWLYQPEGTSRGLIVWVHGGPTWHSEDWVNPKITFHVQAGYIVLDANYRGSTGFGMRYREAIKEDGWGGREQGDIRSGIESLIAAGLAQTGKIAMMGISYGGYSSWFAITRMADLVSAAVPICGMYRLDTDYDATEMPHGRAYSEEMMGGTPEALADKYFQASPGNFIDQITGSLLIVHGLADSNVGPENTHRAVRELTAAGIAHEVLLFDNEGHGISRRSNIETFLIRSAAFLERAFA